MPLKYLIDEHLRGDFLESLRIAAQQAGSFLDACQIGDPQAPGLAALDPDILLPDILLWCQAHDRVLLAEVSRPDEWRNRILYVPL